MSFRGVRLVFGLLLLAALIPAGISQANKVAAAVPELTKNDDTPGMIRAGGKPHSYIVILFNRGTSAGTFVIDIDSSSALPGVTTTIDETEVTLAPGAGATLTLKISASAQAPGGQDIRQVRATVKGTTSTAALTFTTSVVGVAAYIPLLPSQVASSFEAQNVRLTVTALSSADPQTWFAEGFIVNHTASPAISLTLEAKFYNDAGELSSTRTGPAIFTAALPEQLTPFKIDSHVPFDDYDPTDATSISWVDVSVKSWQPAPQGSYVPLTVLSQKNDFPGLSGELRNDTTHTVDHIMVFAWEINNGGYYAFDAGHTDVPSLAPGQTSRWSIDAAIEGSEFNVITQGRVVP